MNSARHLLILFILTFYLYFISSKVIPNSKATAAPNESNKKENDRIKVTTQEEDNEDKYYIYKDENCAQDVETHCKKVKKENNFAVFVCLQETAHRDEDDVSDECHETMWHYKYNLTRDPRIDNAAFSKCEATLKDKLKKKCPMSSVTAPGFLVSCLVENRRLVEDPTCKTFVMKMSAIVFDDYRLIKKFYDNCAVDVKKTNCGTIAAPDENDEHHAQGNVIGCLEDSINEISEECQQAILHVAELQSDDYHLDRPLFYACQEARERFCHDVKSGEGRVYKCLTNHISEEMMPEDCAEKLLAREKLIQKDVKVDHPLWSACEKDYKKYKCDKYGSKDHGDGSNLLLCLQEKVIEGKPVDGKCQSEMKVFAEQISENYNLSPVLVQKCSVEMKKYCSQHINNRDEGEMLDCLMGITANNTLTDDCFSAIVEVLKERGVSTNYKVDKALMNACEHAISSLCADKDDKGTLGCLMDNAHSAKMPPECAAQVFHLQYFMSRDFRLDSELYRDCEDDAKRICHANDFKAKDESKTPDNFVIACLYRNSFNHASSHVEEKVSPVCAAHVRRVMHQRAQSIKLMPEIETPCLADLAKHCIDKVQDGEVSAQCSSHVRRVMHLRANEVKLMPEIEEPCMHDLGKLCMDKSQQNEEIQCLQDNFDQLTKKCHAAIKEFTELESKDFDLDKHLVEKCGPMVNKFCEREMEDNQGEKVLECLIKNKNEIEMDHLCTNAIEHWQLLEMKDYEFSPSLKEHCFDDVLKLCKSSKSKFEAVTCLSENIVKDYKTVSEKCRRQVRAELVVQSENIQLNPELYDACKADIQKFCNDVPFSGAQVEECLRQNHKKLQVKKCREMLFNQEKVESKDEELDYRMMHVCKPMIKKYCMNLADAQEVLHCLRQNTHDREMSPACREVIHERQVEQAEQFYLDAEVSENCMSEAKQYCAEELAQAKKGYDNGAVFACLANNLMQKKMFSPMCGEFIRLREQEAANDKELNPQLMASCSLEIANLCAASGESDIIECMKLNLPKVKSKACQEEIKRLIAEGVEDIHADPQLNKVCARDIRNFCNDMPQEGGQVVLCLTDVHKAKNLRLQRPCRSFLTKRMQLYKSAQIDMANFDSISAVMDAVAQSPNRNYIYSSVFIILAVLFFGGLCFGRLTKRVRAEAKNR